MKPILFTIFLVISTLLLAQESEEGELLNHISYVHKADKKTTGLEKVMAKMISKTKLGGMGGFSNAYVIEGSKSSVTISAEENLQFVLTKDSGDGEASVPDTVINGMNVADMMSEIMDPSKNISLYKLTTEKGTRKAVMQESGGMFSPKMKDGAEKISFDIRKAKGKYIFVIPKKLKAGEYAFIDMMGGGGMDQTFTAFCFRVE
jgi:hypothetical protein